MKIGGSCAISKSGAFTHGLLAGQRQHGGFVHAQAAVVKLPLKLQSAAMILPDGASCRKFSAEGNRLSWWQTAVYLNRQRRTASPESTPPFADETWYGKMGFDVLHLIAAVFSGV